MEDFIPIGLKEEAERIKRKGLNLEQESAKKQKTSEEVPEEAMSPEEVPKEKVKEMMQLVPIEEVYVEALQVKHPIIDWKVYTEGQSSFWKITRRLINRPPTSDKEIELWVELSRFYESDNEDQLWTHTQNFMHAPVEWKLYDSCGVHHVTAKDKEIFMLVEKDYPLRKEQLPTASEERCHYQKKSEATARKNALLSKVKKKLSPKTQFRSVFVVLQGFSFYHSLRLLRVGEHNIDFHPMVDFIEASPLRIETTEEGTQILATVVGIHRTVTESSLRRNLKLKDEEGISSLADTELFENLTLMAYNISPNQKFTFQKGTPTEPHHTPFPEAQSPSHTTNTSPTLPPVTTTFIPIVTPSDTSIVRQYTRRTRIAQSSVPLTVTDEPASPLRDGRSIDEGEATTERINNDLKEMATVLTSMDATTVLASGVVDVPTGSGSIPTASTPAEEQVPNGSEVVPTASLVFATATVVTPYRRRKGKEVMSQQRKPMTKKQKRDYYMAVIGINLGWKVKDFRGMTFEEVEAKFNSVWKQMEDFIPMGSKEEAERIKRKGLNLEQKSAKKQKTLEEVPEERLVKETLSNIPPTSDKEMELWVELNRLYEPDDEDQLWTYSQKLMHAPVDWRLYDTCGVHHVTAKDKEIFMLVEKDYPLRKALALVMICYKLQVENYSQVANNLVLKI
uniref:Uncharacterized protein n=1 Tax=Tanacetum cinerariifolium TaxID=118510 RepID=A0A6L2MTA7_TANCI|nr:hypothetical protein [Tanacetum cinerariifolium]